ncbi:MAG TPA: hypothetical protein VN734_14105 [Acidobacteriaceae bacterium]|nr:hypothetical protein [Acidobacteriaceae bacterium]
MTGLREAQMVLEYYRSSPPTALEMANALRVAALAEVAAGERDSARKHWSEARVLYVDAGIADGVLEADRHVALLCA